MTANRGDQFYELSAALHTTAAAFAATPQGKQTQEFMHQLSDNPPQSISPSPEDQDAWNNAFENPKDYAHLHPEGTALADIAFTETDIIETVAQITGNIKEPGTLSLTMEEWID